MYVIHPGKVISKNDGQEHHVGAQRLAQLYGIHGGWVIYRPEATYPSAVHLYPDPTGVYDKLNPYGGGVITEKGEEFLRQQMQKPVRPMTDAEWEARYRASKPWGRVDDIQVGSRVRVPGSEVYGTVREVRVEEAFAAVEWDAAPGESNQWPWEKLEAVEPVPKFSSVEEADAWLEAQAAPAGHPFKVMPADTVTDRWDGTGHAGSIEGMGGPNCKPGDVVDVRHGPGTIKVKIDSITKNSDGSFRIDYSGLEDEIVANGQSISFKADYKLT